MLSTFLIVKGLLLTLLHIILSMLLFKYSSKICIHTLIFYGFIVLLNISWIIIMIVLFPTSLQIVTTIKLSYSVKSFLLLSFISSFTVVGTIDLQLKFFFYFFYESEQVDDGYVNFVEGVPV